MHHLRAEPLEDRTTPVGELDPNFGSGGQVIVPFDVGGTNVDVPAASVGIILSGTGTVREHVQRLGRLLRKHGDKQAILYEVVTRNTAEEFTSERRRQHHAYR